jgi:hypothetical protein
MTRKFVTRALVTLFALCLTSVMAVAQTASSRLCVHSMGYFQKFIGGGYVFARQSRKQGIR